jgi:lipid II:glycine glycyltransferase (peptidoglycan interpeptide bridge formation enzyme)
MSFVVKEVANKEFQEGFLRKVAHAPFLQSFVWGDFQREIGNRVYRFGMFESDKVVGVVSAYSTKAKFTSYLYVPWGPVLNDWKKDQVAKIFDQLLEVAKKENLDFIRLEPRTIGDSEAQILIKLGFRKNRSFTQPECTALVDLSKSEEELLSSMGDSTRYNVRMVERRGVNVRKGSLEDLPIFGELLKETSVRHRFTTDIHPDYYKNQYKTLKKEDAMDIFIAEYEDEPLAASLVTFYGDTATYLHTASGRSRSKLRPTYLLVWKSILEGKKAGFKYFDFWGVAPEDAGENHSWSGVTSFKMSFGGKRVCYSPVFDFPTSNRYKIAKLAEVARKPIRKILRFS